MKNLFILSFFITAQLFAQFISINEFMSKNENSITDQDNDYSDWIELYNASEEAKNLLNYSLSDDENNLTKWMFPELIIEPKATILIFASGKNRILQELHTNFKISSKGESLLLSDSEGILIDIIPAINLEEDDSFGRLPDGSNNLIHLENYSPGNSNNFTSQPFLSKKPGFFNEPFYLNIQSLMGDTIYFTLDGSEPSINSFMFSDSLFIYNKSANPNYFSEFPSSPELSLISYHAWTPTEILIDKATIIRYQSFKNGQPSSKIYTSTYFVNQDIYNKYKLPIISLVTEEYNLFNHNNGIYIPGVHFNINEPEWTGNYFQSGEEWEKPVHIEYFDKDGNLKFNQDAGLRIHGGSTKVAAQKSLRLYARNQYGKKYFNYSLLGGQNSQFKRFILRTSMASWYDQSIIKDVLAHEIARDLNIETQDFQPVIVFLNGEFWGIQTIRDRIDEHYIEYKYDIHHDSIDMIFGGNYNIIFNGNDSNYLNILDFLEDNTLIESENYEYLKTQIDIDNFIDYYIAEMFFANYDWPNSNIKLWRSHIEGAKWRWIFYDIDAGMNNADYNMFLHLTNTDESNNWNETSHPTFLFRRLIENHDFVSNFVKRYDEILNNEFMRIKMLIKLDSIKDLYTSNIESHINRWNYPNHFNQWEMNIELLADFLEKRPCTVQENIINFLNPNFFEFSCTHQIKSNYISLAPNPHQGSFYIKNISQNRILGDLTISSITGKIIYKEQNISIDINNKKHITLFNPINGIYILKFESILFCDKIKFIVINE